MSESDIPDPPMEAGHRCAPPPAHWQVFVSMSHGADRDAGGVSPLFRRDGSVCSTKTCILP
jgi:hypothetical protein